MDGLSGELKQSTSSPFVLSGAAAAAHVAFVTTTIGLRAGVTRLQNGLIEVAIEPHYGSRTVSVTANVSDNEPFAIRMTPATDARQIIVVVTIRRIKRADD